MTKIQINNIIQNRIIYITIVLKTKQILDGVTSSAVESLHHFFQLLLTITKLTK